MQHYKDPETNALYAYEEDGSQDSVIPTHLVPITNAEADAIRAANAPQVDPVQVIKEQIAAIEYATIMNRAAREALLSLTEKEEMRALSVDQATAQAGLYAGNVGYRKVKDIDNQVAALRAQIGAL